MDWLNPFSALIALGVVALCILSGATFLLLKTEDKLRKKATATLRSLLLLLLFGTNAGLWAWTHDYYLTTK